MDFISIIVTLVPTLLICKYYLNTPLVNKFNSIHNIKDVINFITYVCDNKSTEYTVEALTDFIITNADHIHESTIKRLSDIAKQYDGTNGKEGYAIALVWSCVVAATCNHVLNFYHN